MYATPTATDLRTFRSPAAHSQKLLSLRGAPSGLKMSLDMSVAQDSCDEQSHSLAVDDMSLFNLSTTRVVRGRSSDAKNSPIMKGFCSDSDTESDDDFEDCLPDAQNGLAHAQNRDSISSLKNAPSSPSLRSRSRPRDTPVTTPADDSARKAAAVATLKNKNEVVAPPAPPRHLTHPATATQKLFNEEFCDEKLALMVQLAKNPGTGWISASKCKEYTLQRKTVPGSNVHVVMGYGVLHGSHFPVVVRSLLNSQVRRKWDPSMIEFELLEKLAPGPSDICCHSTFLVPVMGVSNRDFCQIRTVRYFEDEKGPYVFIAFKSMEHPKCPPKYGNTRAHTFQSGWMCRPHETEDGSVATYVSVIGQNDIKGWIPTSLINQGLGPAMAKWFKAVHKTTVEETQKNLPEKELRLSNFMEVPESVREQEGDDQ